MGFKIGRFAGLLLFIYLKTSDGAILAPTLVNNEKTVDGPLRISSYMSPLAGDPTLKQLGSGLFERDMVELLASVFNFTFSPHKPPDVVSIGVRDANETWNGCMGEFVRQSQTGPLKWVSDDLKKYPERKLNQNEFDRVFDIVKYNNVVSCPVIGIFLPLLEIDRQIHKPPLLYRSRQRFYTRGRTMVVQKGSPLRPMLDKQILLMQQHGLVDYISRRHLPVEPNTKRKEELKVLSLTDLIGAFILYGICFGLSLISNTFTIAYSQDHGLESFEKPHKLENEN